MVLTRAHVFVSGRVQGVFFRYETRSKALELGLTGWVRNLPDGKVEALIEGEKEAVEKLIEFCRTGPPGAKVTHIDVKWEKPTGEYDDFTVKY